MIYLLTKSRALLLGLMLLLGTTSFAAHAETSVSELAGDLAAAASVEQIEDLVDAARADGLTDEQIANAFGRASTMTANPDLLSQAYSSFVAGSSISAQTLGDSYTAGTTTGGGLGGNGGSSSGGDPLNPPSGGSGGGGGSSNE